MANNIQSSDFGVSGALQLCLRMVVVNFARRALTQLVLLTTVLLIGLYAIAQQPNAPSGSMTVDSAVQSHLPDGPAKTPTQVSVESSFEPQHGFWDRRNALLFSGVGAARALDFASTLNMRARGRDEIMLSNWVVDNRPLFAGIEAAGAGASIGLSYLMHRIGHHKVERWISIGHISGAAFGSVRNYCLESHHGN